MYSTLEVVIIDTIHTANIMHNEESLAAVTRAVLRGPHTLIKPTPCARASVAMATDG